MIKVNVIVKDKSWSKIIKNPENYLKKLKIFKTINYLKEKNILLAFYYLVQKKLKLLIKI